MKSTQKKSPRELLTNGSVNGAVKVTPPADQSANTLLAGITDLIGHKEGEIDLDLLLRLKCQLESGQESDRIADRWGNFLCEAAKVVPIDTGEGRDAFACLLDALKANAPKVVPPNGSSAGEIAPPSVTERKYRDAKPFDIQKFHRLAVELQEMEWDSDLTDDLMTTYALFEGKALREPMELFDPKKMHDALMDVVDEASLLLGEAATSYIRHELESQRQAA